MKGILALATTIIGGVMLADLVTHQAGTTALFNGIGGLWRISLTACSACRHDGARVRRYHPLCGL